MSDLYAWQRIAVLGLNNHSGSLPISENIAAVYPDKSEADPVKCFLDLAALTYGSNAFASLPEKEGFDELPALPSESLATISDGLAKQFQPYLRKHVFHGLLFALFQKNLHIPERWLQTSLKACQNDSSLTEMLRAVISEKLRWLAALNPEWHKVLNTDDRLTHLPLSLQLIALEKLPPEDLATKVIENWAQLTPTNSVHWLSYCHQANEESLNSLLALSRKERSRKTRRVLLRLLAVHDVDELQAQASKLLENFLSSKSKLLRDSVVINVPETLTDELSALKINDFDYTELHPTKAVLRLGQLMVLAGTKGITSSLNKSVVQSYKAIAASSFSKELAPFLLEAALWSQDEEAIKTWCQCYKGKKCPSLSLSALIVGVDKTTVRTLLSELVATKNKLWLDADFFKWLYNYNFSLDLACSKVFTTFLLSELKRGIYHNQAIFVKLLGLLSPEVLPALQNAIEESTVNANFSEELLTVLRFRHALENET